MHKVLLERLRAEAREKWRTATPYRIGLLVGEHGIETFSPYPQGTRGWHLYHMGVGVGKKQTKTAQSNTGSAAWPTFQN